MKKAKLTGLLLLVFGFCMVIFTCQQETQQNYPGPTIALVPKTLNHPFFIDMQRGAEQAAESLKVNLIVQAAEREVDVEKQMQIIENLIQRRVDALCIAPSGSKELVPAVVKANNKNIPLLIVDTRLDETALKEAEGKIVTFIGSDNFQGGKLAGEFVAQKLNYRGKIAILEGIPGHETGDQRLRGFHSVIDSIPGLEIVASQTANWERDQGYNVFQNILQSHPDVDALFACNDLMALGAVEAIAAVSKTGEILVVGFDALDDAIEAIRQGKMAGSIAQHPYDMGRLAVISAVKYLNGESIPEYIPVDIELITKETLE